MIVATRTDFGPNVPAGVRVFHTVQVACNRCRKQFPAKNSRAPHTDGSRWDEEYQRLVLNRKYRLTERIEGNLRVDLCQQCIRREESNA